MSRVAEVGSHRLVEEKPSFPVLLEPRAMVDMRLVVGGIPMSYLIDKQGRVVGRDVGARNWNRAEVRRLLEQLLAENGM